MYFTEKFTSNEHITLSLHHYIATIPYLMQKNIKVILLKDVKNLGRTGDVKEVAAGHARNFLIPNGWVVEATPQSLAEAEARKAKVAAQAEADLAQAESMVSKLEGGTFELSAKASEAGTLYAAVSAAKIAAVLKDKGFEVKKDHIKTPEIKEVGEHEVTVTLDHGLEARLTLVVNSE